MVTRRFEVPNGRGVVEFTEEVLLHMYSHAQRGYFAREAGGQLFSQNVHHQVVRITHATGPNPGDRRSRHRLEWDDVQANADRTTHFLAGRHPVGIWHTHPEAMPKPSAVDERTTQKFLEALGENMQGFLLVIIVNKGTIPAMTVCLTQNNTFQSWVELREANIEISAECRLLKGDT